MKYLKLFESWITEETIVLTSNRGEKIEVSVKNGRIESINNESQLRFPFFEGQLVTVFMKQWACSNRFKWNGENACAPGEKKVFGIKAKYIPQGHELRRIFPGKFRD